MCFYVGHRELKTAKEDITVYKDVRKIYFLGFIRNPFKCESLYSYMIYKRNKLNYKVNLRIIKYIGNPIIEEGYHSYIKNDTAYDCGNAEFVIPKGSVYYENDFERVSSNIIFKRFI